MSKSFYGDNLVQTAVSTDTRIEFQLTQTHESFKEQWAQLQKIKPCSGVVSYIEHSCLGNGFLYAYNYTHNEDEDENMTYVFTYSPVYKNIKGSYFGVDKNYAAGDAALLFGVNK